MTTDQLPMQHPIESAPYGYVALHQNPSLPSDGMSLGMYARRDPDDVRRNHPACVVTNVRRARHVLREYHDWTLPTTDELRSTTPNA